MKKLVAVALLALPFSVFAADEGSTLFQPEPSESVTSQPAEISAATTTALPGEARATTSPNPAPSTPAVVTVSAPSTEAPTTSIPLGEATSTSTTEGSALYLALLAGAVALLASAYSVSKFSQKSSAKEKGSGNCDEIKARLEAKKQELASVTAQVSLQEQVINALKEKAEEKAKDAALSHAAKVAGVTQLKDAYDKLDERYGQAKTALELLQSRRGGLAGEVKELETAYQLCMLGGVVGAGGSTVLNAALSKKLILVDAIGGIALRSGGTYEPLHQLLESYPNKKVIVTNANTEEIQKFGLDKLPYELFTLNHAPEKTDPEYYRKLLQHFTLNPQDVVYFEHNPDAVLSARSVGIETHFWDESKQDIEALKEFLNRHS